MVQKEFEGVPTFEKLVYLTIYGMVAIGIIGAVILWLMNTLN